MTMTTRAHTAYSLAWLILAGITIALLMQSPDRTNTAAAVLTAWVGGLITVPLTQHTRTYVRHHRAHRRR